MKYPSVFTCVYCCRNFTNHDHFRRHKRRHKNATLYGTLKPKTKLQSSLKQKNEHVSKSPSIKRLILSADCMSKQANSKYKCPNCMGKLFSTNVCTAEIADHPAVQVDCYIDPVHWCLKCGASFTEVDLKSREEKVHKESVFNIDKLFDFVGNSSYCHICKGWFSSTKEMEEHLARNHNCVFCTFCQKYFIAVDFLIHQISDHKCPYCNDVFKFNSLQVHIESAHRCAYCRVCFTGDLKSHIKSEHFQRDDSVTLTNENIQQTTDQIPMQTGCNFDQLRYSEHSEDGSKHSEQNSEESKHMSDHVDKMDTCQSYDQSCSYTNRNHIEQDIENNNTFGVSTSGIEQSLHKRDCGNNNENVEHMEQNLEHTEHVLCYGQIPLHKDQNSSNKAEHSFGDLEISAHSEPVTDQSSLKYNLSANSCRNTDQKYGHISMNKNQKASSNAEHSRSTCDDQNSKHSENVPSLDQNCAKVSTHMGHNSTRMAEQSKAACEHLQKSELSENVSGCSSVESDHLSAKGCQNSDQICRKISMHKDQKSSHNADPSRSTGNDPQYINFFATLESHIDLKHSCTRCQGCFKKEEMKFPECICKTCFKLGNVLKLKFTCPYCGFIFPSKDKLQMHATASHSHALRHIKNKSSTSTKSQHKKDLYQRIRNMCQQNSELLSQVSNQSSQKSDNLLADSCLNTDQNAGKILAQNQKSENKDSCHKYRNSFQQISELPSHAANHAPRRSDNLLANGCLNSDQNAGKVSMHENKKSENKESYTKNYNSFQQTSERLSHASNQSSLNSDVLANGCLHSDQNAGKIPSMPKDRKSPSTTKHTSAGEITILTDQTSTSTLAGKIPMPKDKISPSTTKPTSAEEITILTDQTSTSTLAGKIPMPKDKISPSTTKPTSAAEITIHEDHNSPSTPKHTNAGKISKPKDQIKSAPSTKHIRSISDNKKYFYVCGAIKSHINLDYSCSHCQGCFKKEEMKFPECLCKKCIKQGQFDELKHTCSCCGQKFSSMEKLQFHEIVNHSCDMRTIGKKSGTSTKESYHKHKKSVQQISEHSSHVSNHPSLKSGILMSKSCLNSDQSAEKNSMHKDQKSSSTTDHSVSVCDDQQYINFFTTFVTKEKSQVHDSAKDSSVACDICKKPFPSVDFRHLKDSFHPCPNCDDIFYL